MAVTVSYRSTGLYNSAGSTTAVVPAPTGLTDGDLIFVVIRRSSATSPSATPSGWTLLRSVQATYGFWVYYKIASGEGASWTWTWAASSKTLGRSHALYGNIDTANPIQTSTTPYSATASGTVITIPTLTTTAANTLSILFSSAYSTGAKTFTVPTSPAYTEYNDSGNASPDFYQAIAGYIYPTSGTTTGAIAYPVSASSTYRVGCQVLVNTKEPNIPPSVSLGVPANGAYTIDLSPTFSFVGSDPDTTLIEYNVQIDTVDTFDSQAGNPQISAFSASSAGFSAGHPFTAGIPVDYTSVSNLSVGVHYWRVAAIDPTGSNTYGQWSETRSINITDNLSPSVALGSPPDLASGQTRTLTLSFTGTDPENDSIEYEVQIDTVATFDSVPGSPGGSIYSNGFEAAGWTSTLVSGSNAAWSIVTSTTNPTGIPIPEGTHLARFNSYTCQAGAQARFTPSTTFNIPASAGSASATFRIYHETGYTTAIDQVQLQTSINGGVDWVNIGNAASRYNGTTAWEQITVDISAYIGTNNLMLGLLGISQYGNDCHVDDIQVTYMLSSTPAISRSSATDAGFTAGHPYASGVTKNYKVQSVDILADSTAYYWRARAIDPLGSNLYGAWTAVRSFTVGNLPPSVGLDLPVDGQMVSTTPVFDFVGIDTEDDAVEFNIQIDTLNTFNSQSGSPLISAFSLSDAGFSAGHPYASGDTVTYSVQSALSIGTYYWRLAAIDPLGKNIYGDWSPPQGFQVVNNAPPYVVLTYPNDGAQGVPPNATLEFTGTDPEGDMIEYHIQIDTVPTFNSNGGGSASTLYSDSFESTNWTTSLVSGSNASWTRSTSSAHPAGVSAENGSYLAGFNSYTCQAGAQARFTASNNITIPSGAGSARLSFWMYKDTAYPTSNDRVQLQISRNGGSSWVNVGASVSRYNGNAAWEQTTVDISSYIGSANIRIAFLGISAYGDDCYIDNAVITYDMPIIDHHSTSDIGFSSGHPFASGSATTYTLQPTEILIKGTPYYWRARAIDPLGINIYGLWSSVNGFLPNTGIKVQDGLNWTYKPVKVWSGSAWIEKPVKVWNGTSWVIKG